MEKPLEAYMRMGIVHFMAFPDTAGGGGPWEASVRQIALDPFFDAIEITHIEEAATRERVRDVVRLAGLSVGYGAHPAILGQKLDLNALDEDARSEACARLSRHLDEAAYMGAETFVILSGKDPGPDRREEAFAALVKSLGELCAYSEKIKGPKVVAEVFDCDVDKCCLLGPSAIAERLGREMTKRYENFGLLVDLRRGFIPSINISALSMSTPAFL